MTASAKPVNSLTLPELEKAFKETVAAYGADAFHGIEGGRVFHEDSLPWCEAYGGTLSLSTAMDFVQDLANALRVRVLFHSATSDGVCCLMDFDEEAPAADGSLPSFAQDPDREEFFKDYGEPVYPQ